MTTSNDDQTMQLPEFDATTPLPTTPDAVPDATVDMPTSDPLAVFRDEPNTQMPSEPAPAGGFTGAGARTAFDPASTGESVPPADEAGAGQADARIVVAREPSATSDSPFTRGLPTESPQPHPSHGGSQPGIAPPPLTRAANLRERHGTTTRA